MPEPMLPLFPLQVVLLPGSDLPLHIFEERYKEMIGEAIRDSSEFGVVQASDKGILNVGCTATVANVVNRYEDGRLDILTRGRRRFEIILLDQEKEFLRAAVNFFDDDDDDPAPADLRAITLAALKLLPDEDLGDLPDPNDPRLSFKVGDKIPDLRFRQLLLSIRSETDRLKQLASYLPEFVAKARRTSHMRRLAPRNGHGFHAPEEAQEK